METLYYIHAWDKTFEKAQTRKIKSPMPWVAMPTDHQSREYRRILRYQSAPSVLGVWCMVVQLAARMPTRGILADSHGPLDVEDIADEIGFDPEIVEQAFEVLMHPRIKWLRKKEVSLTGSEVVEPLPVRSQRGGASLEPHNITEHNRTEHITSSSTPPPSTPDDEGEEGEGEAPSFLTNDEWSLLQSIWRTGKIERRRFDEESWKERLRACPEFDCANAAHTGYLVTSLKAMSGKMGNPASWFGTWMPKACKGKTTEQLQTLPGDTRI
jgi:hypothetical protein